MQPIYLHAHKLMRKCWGDMPSPGDIGGSQWKEVSNMLMIIFTS